MGTLGIVLISLGAIIWIAQAVAVWLGQDGKDR
jgi:hypothetical protein